MTGKLIPGSELISPSFRQCDKQDHTGSRVSGYRASWMSFGHQYFGPAILRICVLSQDQAYWFLSVPFDQVPL